MHFEVNSMKVFPLFDTPHLLKGIRNNLLNKDAKFIENGQEKWAKWEHLKMLLAIDVGDDEIRLVNKLTENHVNKDKLKKMKVKLAAQSMPEEKQSLQELMGRLLVEEERSGSIPSSSASTAPQDSALEVEFCELKAKRFLTMGDGTKLEVLGTGKVIVWAFNGSSYVSRTLDDVLYVPNLKVNLFSLASAVNKGHTMVSDSNGYWHIKFAHQNYKYVKEFLDLRGINMKGRLISAYHVSRENSIGYHLVRVVVDTRRVETHRDIVFVKVKSNSDNALEKDETENEEENTRDVQQQKEARSIAEDVASSEVHMMEEYLDEEFLDAEEDIPKNEEKKNSRSKRQVKKPAWTKDYDLAMTAQGEEQLTYEEAVNGKYKEEWLKVIQAELEALCKNETWKENVPKKDILNLGSFRNELAFTLCNLGVVQENKRGRPSSSALEHEIQAKKKRSAVAVAPPKEVRRDGQGHWPLVNATDPICVKLEPENCGWFLDEYLKPVGFIGDHTLLKIEDIVKKSETESDDEEDSEVEDRSFMSDDSDSE
ncbi:unnamed protein product, partial [Brenthis ino]